VCAGVGFALGMIYAGVGFALGRLPSRCASGPPGRVEVLQAGPKPVELGVDHGGVPTGRGVPAQRVAGKGERRCRSSQLVLGTGDKLGIRHTASVSL
jgi:hypothetical protein